MTAPAAARGNMQRVDWTAMDEPTRARWLSELRPPEPAAEVTPILEAVRGGGDAALRELTERYDGARLGELWATTDEFAAAESQVPDDVVAALSDAARTVQRFHAEQAAMLRSARAVETLPGVSAWRRFVPLHRVGGYVPGGRAALASSVLMLGVPARLAGVDELIIATPPGRDGAVAPAILVAARLVGVDRVLKVGGAQAIAALAYGTESVPRVDRIFGAGSAWVTAAKRAVAQEVPIDLPAGPSECLILADASADPRFVALDLLGQAEHGPDSLAILVTDSAELAKAVEAALPAAASALATGEAALGTLQNLGRVVIVPSMGVGLEVVEAIGPEHVSLQCTGAQEMADRVRSAGAVFIGPWTPIAAGDYAIGTNHVLPTGGAARAWSGVGVESFGRWVEVQRATPAGLARMTATVQALAGAEGLAAHAASVSARAERAGELPPAADTPALGDGRSGSALRETTETQIRASLNLDGSGRASVDTGSGFLDHLLELLARHALIDLELVARGDLQVDEHHTAEDCGIVIGRALDAALGERTGIRRFGQARLPMDEAIGQCAIDVGGRYYARIRPRRRVTRSADPWLELLPHLLESLAREARLTVHLEVRRARSVHHHCEAMIKSFGRALRMAVELDPRLDGAVPSSKGTLR
jgi:histidinol dehydrogenase